MPRVTDNLRNAQILADFSNLEPAQVEYFRNNYPDFAPHLWWDYQYKGSERAWESTQKSLRHAWGNQFKDGILNLLGLLNSVTAPLRLADAERAGYEKVKEMFGEQAAQETAKRFLGEKALTLQPSETRVDDHIPIQRAIVYLFENSWRARFCAQCKKRFVAAEPRNKFCSDECSRIYGNERKADWFETYDKAMRKKYGKSWRRKKYGRGKAKQ